MNSNLSGSRLQVPGCEPTPVQPSPLIGDITTRYRVGAAGHMARSVDSPTAYGTPPRRGSPASSTSSIFSIFGSDSSPSSHSPPTPAREKVVSDSFRDDVRDATVASLRALLPLRLPAAKSTRENDSAKPAAVVRAPPPPARSLVVLAPHDQRCVGRCMQSPARRRSARSAAALRVRAAGQLERMAKHTVTLACARALRLARKPAPPLTAALEALVVDTAVVCADGMCHLAGLRRCVCSEGYGLYVVRVRRLDAAGHGHPEWETCRRYSEFRTLHLALAGGGGGGGAGAGGAFARALAGQLPPRLGKAVSTLPPVVAARRRALDRYLQLALGAAREEGRMPDVLERFLRGDVACFGLESSSPSGHS